MKYSDIVNNWTNKQKQILDDSENFVVEGIAGSGKTLLAIEKAKMILDKKLGSVQVVVFTKALSKFIEVNISFPDLPKGIVLHYHKWKELNKTGKKVDYLIVDELQDFSNNEITDFVNSAERCYFFRDSKQQIYNIDQNPGQNSTLIHYKDIISISYNQIKFKVYHLGTNLRTNNEIVTFINKIYALDDLSGLNYFGKKPELHSFKDANEEIEWIYNYLKNKNEDIGILLHKNEGVIKSKDIGVSIDKKSMVEIDSISAYGVKEFSNYLISKNIEIGYKNKFDEKLTFSSKENTKNIMTIHSSKGLQFNTVILPFINTLDWVNPNLLYTAMTRASKKLIITMNSAQYKGAFFNFLTDEENNKLYEIFLNDMYLPVLKTSDVHLVKNKFPLTHYKSNDINSGHLEC